MIQLVLDTDGLNVTLPESRKGGYTPSEEDLSVDVSMVSGRMVRELKGVVWVINYQYGYFNDEDKNKVISACKKGRTTPITCLFLPPDSSEMKSSKFFVTDFVFPKFMWSKPHIVESGGSFVDEPVPMWGDFSVTLREVIPHD